MRLRRLIPRGRENLEPKVGLHGSFHRPIYSFPRCEIHYGLGEAGPQVDVVVGAYDGRQSEAWKLELEA